MSLRLYDRFIQVTSFGLFATFLSLAAMVAVPAAASYAARLTGHRSIFWAGLLFVAIQVVFRFISGQVIQASFETGWLRGGATMGQFVAVFQYIAALLNSLMLGALIVFVARAAQGHRTG